MNMDKSIWSEFDSKKEFPSLDRDIECETLVIGGGIAGILTAYYLKEAGKQVILVEGNTIGDGVTKNTTAVITAQHDTPYSKLIKMHGVKKAKAYLDINLSAVEEYKRLAQGIDCDFEIKPSYMYSEKHGLDEEYKALLSLGYEAELVGKTPLPIDVKSAVKFSGMAEFHPLKFMYAIARELEIYENTFVVCIEDNSAYTDKYRIRFKEAIVATHFPFINSHGAFFIKMHQRRSYVMALENAGDVGGTYIDDMEEGFYFRNYRDILLVGKGEHRPGTHTNAIEELENFKSKYFPKADVKRMWANQDCVTLDSMPYIGRYGAMKSVYVTTGFNLWGMTGSMVGAMLIRDMLTGRENEYLKVFSPKRRILRLQLFANIGEFLLNMIFPTVKRCPHMGCALKYNKREHSWDCSCHGSRFNEDGKIIDNPSTKDAKV